MGKEIINEKDMEQVVGGYMNFNYNTKVLTYTHEETREVTTYQILNFDEAWKLNNEMHGQGVHEDQIIAALKSKGYIK